MLKRFQYPFQPGHAPPSDARDYQGNLLGHVTETVYAIKRGKGPWEGLVMPTSPFAAQGLYGCGDGQSVLRSLYNGNGDVQNALSALEMDPLVCQGWLIWGQPTTWGSLYHQFRRRIINIVVNGISSDPIPEITSAILESAERPMEDGTIGTPYTLSDVSNVVVSQWNGTSTSEIFAVTVENIGDPRLWPITRTAAPPGLYQFTVILKDGGIITEFMEFNDVTILRADFASFTGVNIYPVPVTDSRFAIDIDLGLPTSINLTVVNNMGHHF